VVREWGRSHAILHGVIEGIKLSFCLIVFDFFKGSKGQGEACSRKDIPVNKVSHDSDHKSVPVAWLQTPFLNHNCSF
jgi:hypothetical protein